MTDETTGEVKGESENVAIGSHNRQRTDSRNQRQGDQTFTFTNSDSMQLMFKLQEMTADIRDVKSDVRALDLKIDGLPDRVGKLEKLEVTVRPVVETTNSANLSVRMIITLLSIVSVVTIGLVVFLVYVQVNGG